MAKTRLNSQMDFSQVPSYFADQPAGLLVGPFVSKITFGVQDDDNSEYPRPVVTVAIPTVALVELVADLRFVLEEESFKKMTITQLDAAKKRIGAGISTAPSPAIRENMVTGGPSGKKKALPGKKK